MEVGGEQSLSLCAMHGQRRGLPPLSPIWLPSLNVGGALCILYSLWLFQRNGGPASSSLPFLTSDGGWIPASQHLRVVGFDILLPLGPLWQEQDHMVNAVSGAPFWL